MATIDELNFKLILDDKDFNETVRRAEETAKNLNTNLSGMLNISAEISRSLGKTSQEAAKAAQAQSKVTSAQERAKQAATKTAIAEERLTQAKARTVQSQYRIATEQEREKQAVTRTAIEQEKLTQAKAKTAQAQSNAAAAQERARQSTERTNTAMKSQSAIMRELSGLAATYFSVRTVGSFLSSIYRISGEFDYQRMALRNILQDADAANKVFAQLKDLAVQSPFTLKELTSYTKQITAFSIPKDELMDTVKMLADVSAGLGVSMDRIILAYGQVRSASFLRGQEIRQFTEAGIPFLEMLAQQFSELENRVVSVGEVFDKVSARQVPFDMVKKAFQDMTAEGGKFYNMQEVLSETLKGRMMKLKDTWEIAVSEIGDANSGVLKKSVDMAISLAKHIGDIGKVVVSVASGFGTYYAILLSVNAAQKIMKGINLAADILRLGKVMGYASAAALGLGGSLNVVAGAAGAITLLGVAIYQVVRNATELNRELDKLGQRKAEEADKLVRGFNDLVEKLKNAKEGTQNYRDAIHELNSKYGEYLPNLLTEKSTYDEIALSANNAAAAIRNKVNASMMEEGEREIEEQLGASRGRAREGLVNELADFLMPSGVKGKKAKEAAKETAREQADAFISTFTEEIENGDVKDVQKAFGDSFAKYFGKEFDFDATYWHSTVGHTNNMFLANLVKYNNAYVKAAKGRQRLNNLYGRGTTYDNEEIRKFETDTQKWYDEQLAIINHTIVGTKNLNEAIKKLDIEKFSKLRDFYSNAENDRTYRPDLAKSYANQIKALQGVSSEWMVKVQGVIDKYQVTHNDMFPAYNVARDTDYFEYFQKLQEGIKSVQDRMRIAATDDQKKKLQDELDLIISIADALGKRDALYDKITHYSLYTAPGEGDSGLTEEQKKEKKQIETQISAIKDLKSAYDDLRQYVDDTTAKGILHELYGDDADQYLNTGKDLETQLTDLAKALETYDKKAAASILFDAKKSKLREQLDNLKESQAALDKLTDILEQAGSQMRNLFGEGVAFDVSKIIDSQTIKNAKADAEMEKSLKTLSDSELAYRKQNNEESWEDYKAKAEQTIKAVAKSQRAANKAEAEEQIRDLAQKFFKEQIKSKNGGVMPDFSQMSIGAIDALIDNLDQMADNATIEKLFPDVTVENMKELRDAFEDFLKQYKELIKTERTESLTHKFEEMAEYSKQIASHLSKVGSTFESMGGGWERVGSIFNVLGEGMESLGNLQDIMSKMQKNGGSGKMSFGKMGEWLSKLGSSKAGGKASMAVVAAENILKIVSMVGTQIWENRRKQKEWNQTVKDCEMEYKKLVLDDMDYQQQNLFGMEDPFKKAKDGAEQYLAAIKDLQDMEEELANGKVKTKLKKVVSGKNTAKGLGAGAAAGAAIGTMAGGAFGTAIGTAIGAIVGGIAGLFGGKKKKTVWTTLANKYGNIIEEGSETYELNKQILADYDKMDDATKKLIDNWDEIRQKALDAEEQMKENFSEFVGSMGDDIVDEITSAFRDGDIYQAMDDMHDYMERIMEDILSRQVVSAIFTPMFDELQQRMQDSYKINNGAYDESIIDDLMDFANQIPSGLQLAFEALKAVQDEMGQMDYHLWDSEGTSELTNGIKSITETTANLLASYVNAIRADVSLNTTQIQDIRNALVEFISGFTAPNLTEYLAKIEAHTANIATDMKSLLSSFKGVITTEQGSPAIAVVM